VGGGHDAATVMQLDVVQLFLGDPAGAGFDVDEFVRTVFEDHSIGALLDAAGGGAGKHGAAKGDGGAFCGEGCGLAECG